ncbi:choice-of-anchor I family protein [Acuticoccus sediminis]|uniref:choice-of-anchor I family protein n=1 Tax=Acuticoccus sediminis TaxID=2184697 RepID=UPI001CFDB33A|nr:choice-of-anchor I family protein [Acuticoccus sediminis]
MEDAPTATGELVATIVAQLDSTVGEGGSEVVAHEDGRLYVTNGAIGAIDVYDIESETLVTSFDLTALAGYESLQSVDVRNGVVAAAIARPNLDDGGTVVGQPGFVAFFAAGTGALLSTADVGNLPDSIHFTDDGNTLVVAGEGEFNADSDTDDNPLGTIAVIDTSDAANPVSTVLDFASFSTADFEMAGLRVAPGVPVARDAEPEFVAISPDGATAYVTLQENNGIAVVDLASKTITGVVSVGLQDHSVAGLDPEDDGAIGIGTHDNLAGLRMPDAIVAHEIGGETYLFIANEGDGRGDADDGFPGDEARVGDILDGDVPGLSIDPSVDTTGLERLTVSTVDGDTDGDGDIDVLHAFGSRSFSILDTEGNVVFDSGDAFERIVADLAGERFNNDDGDTIEASGGDEVDNRSDAKGPEPEAIAVGEISGEVYAFIGLERDSGVMVYNVTDPTAPSFVTYLEPLFEATGDDVARVGPETIAFISAADSGTGAAQIAVANEISGTTIVYEFVPALAIYDIQGAGHLSAYDGDVVQTTGIVTAVDTNGFYLQDVDGDGNDATSDGIFVFTGSAPAVAVGDEATVTGTVDEYQPGDPEDANLTITEIVSPEVTVLSSGNALPAATLIGAAGRTPPTEVVITDGETPVDLALDPGTFDPAVDGIDFYESLEGMYVQLDDPAVISTTNSYGETWILTDDGAGSTPGLNDRGGININADADGYGDLNPERIQIQEDSGLTPGDIAFEVGTELQDVFGVVSYSFGNFEVLATEAVVAEAESTNTRETAALAGGENELLFATYNVLNVTANEADGDADQIAQLAQQIVDHMGSPDIVALQEIQDDSGVTDDGTLSADETLQAIVDAIAEAGGPRYEFVSAVVDEDGETGGVPGGNIRNAFIYNPDRVELQRAITLESDVLAAYGVSNPDAFEDTRDPLMGVFTFNGETVTVINNHFSSRSGSTPIFGATQEFIQAGEDARQQQALTVNEVVDALLADDPDANVIVNGDLNTFEFTDEVADDLQGTLGGKVLTNLIDGVDEGERYTYVFDGNSQVLDHILVSNNLAGQAEADIVHVNNDFLDYASDHEPVVARITIGLPRVVVGTDGDDTLQARADGGRVDGLGGDDIITGSRADDRLFGGTGTDTVNGMGGDDVIVIVDGIADGGAGADRVVGGNGDNVLHGGGGSDELEGRRGNDVLFGDDGRDTVLGQGGDDVIRGGNGRDELSGGAGDDTVVGNAGDDVAGGNGDNDLVAGQDGDDTLLGGNGLDTLLGGDGDDSLSGGAKADQLSGGNGNDTLFGDDGHDQLFGNDGDDFIVGGAGNDTATGGAGADTFVFESGAGALIIADFEQGTDLLAPLTGPVDFDELSFSGDTIRDADGDVVVRFSDGFLATSLTESDFALIAIS